MLKAFRKFQGQCLIQRQECEADYVGCCLLNAGEQMISLIPSGQCARHNVDLGRRAKLFFQPRNKLIYTDCARTAENCDIEVSRICVLLSLAR